MTHSMLSGSVPQAIPLPMPKDTDQEHGVSGARYLELKDVNQLIRFLKLMETKYILPGRGIIHMEMKKYTELIDTLVPLDGI